MGSFFIYNLLLRSKDVTVEFRDGRLGVGQVLTFISEHNSNSYRRSFRIWVIPPLFRQFFPNDVFRTFRVHISG